jgi:hypothetical protein
MLVRAPNGLRISCGAIGPAPAQTYTSSAALTEGAARAAHRAPSAVGCMRGLGRAGGRSPEQWTFNL